ncbi:MAG: hypothetical protein AAGM22_09025 [Acidobacteriota bacterium]
MTTSAMAQQSRGLFLLSYLGYLTHLGLETLTLHFSRESIDPETWQGYVESMTSPSTEWTLAVFAFLTLLPAGLAILAGGRRMWIATAIVGAVMTVLNALHYVGELAEHFGAVGAMSLVFHILPMGWATWLAWRCSRADGE